MSVIVFWGALGRRAGSILSDAALPFLEPCGLCFLAVDPARCTVGVPLEVARPAACAGCGESLGRPVCVVCETGAPGGRLAARRGPKHLYSCTAVHSSEQATRNETGATEVALQLYRVPPLVV